MSWFSRIFGGKGKSRRVPIMGIQGVGKSYLLYSLAAYVSQRKLGRVEGPGADYFYSLLPTILRGDPLDATTGKRDIELHVDYIYFDNFMKALDTVDEAPSLIEEPTEDSIKQSCNLVLSTSDISGSQFSAAMRRLAEPLRNPEKDAEVGRFMNLVHHCDGLITVIDLVRLPITREEFQADKREHIRDALAEQVLPLFRGIEIALERRRKRKIPLFLVFTKADIHGLDRHELKELIEDVFPMALARFEQAAEIRLHAIQNIGFGPELEAEEYLSDHSQGIGLFLADLYYSIERR